MYKLKLIKGRSYTGAVRATKENPNVEVEKKETADALVASGYFSLEECAEDTGAVATELNKMTVAELAAYAAEKGIDLAGCNKKAEILAKIKETTESGDTADYGEDD